MTDAVTSLTAALADRYRIEREVGQGGMATVYLAHDLKHDRNVAIKVLHSELAHSLGAERFLREITVTSQFDHPYILPLLDSGVVEPQSVHGRRLFYVMPFVEGESLRDRMARERQLPIEDALKLTREVAEALGYAHARGVIHRDIKPENILLSGGHARVGDFGIARAIDAAGGERLTETGLAIGTPAYMSPEQAMAEPQVDGRSDLYALGSVLYEMLAGEPPYTGPTAHAIMAKRMTNPVPSVRTLRETVPASVDHALTRVLARSPADRFPTASQFAEALSPSVTTATPPAGARDTRKHARVAGVGALLALTLLGGWLFARSRRPQVAPSASVIAVLPFMPSSADTALARLGRDLVITVSANLDGVGGIRTADPRLVLAGTADATGGRGTADALALGKSFGAGSVVVGEIVHVGPNIRLDLKLLATHGDAEPMARASITGAPDSISALTDSVTWALLRQVWRRGEPPSPSYANLTTRSVSALRAFLDGERLSQAGRFHEAIDAYVAAIEADSTFWLAAWQYNNARAWTIEDPPDPDLQRQVESHREAFGERDRLLIEAEMGLDTILEVNYFARLRAITLRFPDDWSAWFKYADALHHWGPMIGATNAEARAALQRTVDLNPKLVPLWEHLFAASIGHDSSQAALAAKSLAAFGHESQGTRLLLSTHVQGSTTLLDSIAMGLMSEKDEFPRMLANYSFLMIGFPQVQLELNRRLVALDARGRFAGHAWQGMATAWAARGAWDSALVAIDHWVAADPTGALNIYQTAIAGAWVGDLDTTRAMARRAAAARYLAGLPPDSASTMDRHARLAWADGMLAVLRRDRRGLAETRMRVRQSGAAGADFLERSLAGFDLELRGEKQAAAESLAALDFAATDAEIGGRDPYARSLNHLVASRLLLESGDTNRAVKALAWHEAVPGLSFDPVRFQLFSALAYYELARIEEALGENDLARDHYQQFLRRYDMPPPLHQHLVDEARASVRRLNGLIDTPGPN